MNPGDDRRKFGSRKPQQYRNTALVHAADQVCSQQRLMEHVGPPFDNPLGKEEEIVLLAKTANDVPPDLSDRPEPSIDKQKNEGLHRLKEGSPYAGTWVRLYGMA